MRIFITSILFLSLGITALQAATPYTWIDDNGNVVYSQHPPEDGRPYQRIKGLPQSRGDSSENVEDESANNAGSAKNNQKPEETGYSEKDIARREAMKEKNCQSAKKALDLYTVHKRFRGKDGQVKTMSAEDRQANIKKAETAVKEFCN